MVCVNAERRVLRGGCIALGGLAILPVEDLPLASREDPSQRLAVVVPVYRDFDRAVSFLERWPSANCPPATEHNVDLVLYYARGEDTSTAVTAAVGAENIVQRAGRCFSKTRTVHAHVNEEVRAKEPRETVIVWFVLLYSKLRNRTGRFGPRSMLSHEARGFASFCQSPLQKKACPAAQPSNAKIPYPMQLPAELY